MILDQTWNAGTIEALKLHAKDAVRVLESHAAPMPVLLEILGCVDRCDRAVRMLGVNVEELIDSAR